MDRIQWSSGASSTPELDGMQDMGSDSHLPRRLPGPSRPIGSYSSGVRAGNLVWISGHVGRSEQGALDKGAPVGLQTRRCLHRIQEVLEAEGISLRQVVKVTVFLCDVEDYLEMDAARSDVFGDWKPASSTVVVERLIPADALVEIEVCASVA